MSRSRWSRRSGCRSGRCRSIPIMRRCARCRRARPGTASTSTGRAIASGRRIGAAGDGAADGGRAAAACCARSATRFPVRRDRRRILLAGRAGGDAAGARRSACPSRSRRGAATSISGARGPASAAQIVAAGQAADGLLAVSGALKARHGGARHAGREDPGPPYRHRPRPLPARRPRRGQGGARRRRAAAGHRRRPARAQGPGSRARGAGAAARRDPDPGRRRPGPGRGSSGCARHGAGDRVRFLGTRPHAELPALLAAADVDGAADRLGGARQRLGRGARLRHAGGDHRRRRRPRGDRPAGRRPPRPARPRRDRRGGARAARRSARPGARCARRRRERVQLGAEQRRAVRAPARALVRD